MSDLSKRLLDLHAQTTKLKWTNDAPGCVGGHYSQGGKRTIAICGGGELADTEDRADAAFIAEAHESVPALCAEIEALETELAYERDARRLRVRQTSFAHGDHPEGWSVYNESDRRLSRSGDWDYQPLPSNRSAEWIAEHSWPTMRAAVDAARKAEAK